MENNLQLVPFKDRRYAEIPVDKIKVINSRNREEDQFDMNTESIEQVGLVKPIRVNDRFLDKSGFYELICGEGRLLAHKKLNAETVKAESLPPIADRKHSPHKTGQHGFCKGTQAITRRGLDLRTNIEGRLQEPQLRWAIRQASRARRRQVDSRRRTGCVPD